MMPEPAMFIVVGHNTTEQEAERVRSLMNERVARPFEIVRSDRLAELLREEARRHPIEPLVDRPYEPVIDPLSLLEPTWGKPKHGRVHLKTDEPALHRECAKCGAKPGYECKQTGKYRFHKARLG